MFGLGRADLEHNLFLSQYQLVDAAGRTLGVFPAYFTHPRWSPDGRRIAWLVYNEQGTARIAITDPDGEGRVTLGGGIRSIVAFAWSPDGGTIAAVESAEPSSTSAPRLRWMSSSSDFEDTQQPQRQIWEINVATRRETLLTRDTWSYGGPATDNDPSWSADGTKLVAVRQPTPNYDDFERAQYVTIDVRDGAVRSIVNAPLSAYPVSAPPLFSPAGDAIAYVKTWDGRLPSREDLFVGERDLTGSLDRDLWSCGAGRFSWQSHALIASALDGVAMRLYRVSVDGTTPVPLTGTGGSVEAFSVARTGRIAYAWSTPTQPTEIYLLDPGGRPWQITRVNNISPDLSIAPTRYVQWSDGGHTLHGQLTIPDSADLKRVPLVIEPHGGPQCADDSSFSPFAQYLASNGYAYFRPDPSGSDGYGDWSYKAIVGDWGPRPMVDDMTGVDTVLAQGVGNPNDLFIEGGSYGGYLTSWIITHTTRFKAAVVQVPVTNLLLDYTLSESPNIPRRFFGAKPALDPVGLAEQSPVSYASDMHTPLLIIIGLADTQAPYTQAIEFYKVLRERGAPARLLADPNSGHGPGDPEGAIAWSGATMAWIAEHGGIAIPDAKLPAL